MSIELPRGLRWLGDIAGMAWPEGDEDAMFALARDWFTAGASLKDLIGELRVGCDAAVGSYSGSGADQMKAQFDLFFTGDQSLEVFADGLTGIGASCRECGAQIEHTKLQIIITLAMLAAELAYAVTTLVGAWMVPVIETEAVGVMQIIARTLAARLAANTAKVAEVPMWKLAAISGLVQGGIGAGTEVGIEAYQLA